MTSPATATYTLIPTSQGWMGTVTFALPDQAPPDFVKGCLNQETVKYVESRNNATSYTFRLGPNDKETLQLAIATLVTTAANQLPYEITVIDQDASNPPPQPRKLTPAEQRVRSGGTRLPQLRRPH